MPEQRRRRGRPSKLTEETKKMLLQGIQTGLSYELSCARARISYQTLRNWIKRGEKAKSGEYFDFLEEVKGAEADGALLHTANIVRAGNEGHWQASAWMLERRHPEHYGRRVAAEVTGKGSGPVKQEVSHWSPEKAAQQRAALADLYAKLDAHKAELDGSRGAGP